MCKYCRAASKKKKRKKSTFDEKVKQQKTLNALWIEGIRNSTMSDV